MRFSYRKYFPLKQRTLILGTNTVWSSVIHNPIHCIVKGGSSNAKLCSFSFVGVERKTRWGRVKEEAYSWHIIHSNASFLAFPCTHCAFYQPLCCFLSMCGWWNYFHCFLVGNNIPHLKMINIQMITKKFAQILNTIY